MASYRKYNVNLTEGQKEKLRKHFQKRAPMTLRLSHNQLSGGDQLLLTNTQIRKIEKSKIDGTGTDISRFRLTKKTTRRRISWYFISFDRNSIDNKCFDRKRVRKRTSC